MNDEVEEIKRRIDIVDFISSYLTLKKAGTNFKAVCPFHQEKTPSLMVSPEKQIWHCFGCSEGGDVITFLMKMENLEFPEALKMLAERAGVTLKRNQNAGLVKENAIKKNRLFLINNIAAQVFHKILTEHPSGKTALDYLLKRKLSKQTIKDFLIGYAPSTKILAQYLKKRGFSDNEIQEAGSPDRFFRRIMFPIRDRMDNTLAFTGRVIDPKQEPKYLNTQETAIFHKGRVLYNLDKARAEIKLQKNTIVVEGQMDVISSFQAGVKNVVATSGTALTQEHLDILYRYTPNITFSFDSDTAGTFSAKKAYEMAIASSFNVKMVNLKSEKEAFKDPGEMIAKNPSLWQKAVKNALPVIDWFFNLLFENREQNLSGQEKKEIAKEILPVIKKIPDKIEQAHYINLLSQRLKISEDVIFKTLSDQKTSSQSSQKPAPKNRISSEEILLGLLIEDPEKISDVKTKINFENFDQLENQTIYKKLLEMYNKGDKNFKTRFLKTFDHNIQTKLENVLAWLENYAQDSQELKEDYDGIIAKMRQASREKLKEHYAQEIKKAEEKKDINRLKELIKEFQDAISS